jgi:hypothetical protein
MGGKCQVPNSKFQAANGEWQMASGKWPNNNLHDTNDEKQFCAF